MYNHTDRNISHLLSAIHSDSFSCSLKICKFSIFTSLMVSHHLAAAVPHISSCSRDAMLLNVCFFCFFFLCTSSSSILFTISQLEQPLDTAGEMPVVYFAHNLSNYKLQQRCKFKGIGFDEGRISWSSASRFCLQFLWLFFEGGISVCFGCIPPHPL